MSPPRRGPSDDDLELLVARRRLGRRARRKRRPAALVLVVPLAALVAAGLGGAATFFAFGSGCDLSALHPVTIGQNSFVYAADGSVLGAIPAERNRQPVTLSQMSRWAPRAAVAIEDRRFYEHGGLDPTGIARALWTNIRARQLVEGGSTITQQLVRNLYPISRERTVQRKLREACLAIKLNGGWSKQRILATYLNQVYFGSLAYGIEAAAQTYFAKPARSLTLPEAALLAGLIKAPSAYDPFVAPATARTRRNEVLDAMLASHAITPAQHDWAVGLPLGLHSGRLYTRIREPYFFGYVHDQLVEKYGAETVRSGGLKVYTTISPRYQRLAEQAIRQTLTERTDPAAAVVSIDPASGAIRAMTAVVPGRPDNQFNLLSQARRQPGSTFKAFVLTTAVDQGVDPSSTYYVSAPFTYRPTPTGSCDRGPWWCVKTYDSHYYGWSSIEQATLRSDNTVYAQLTLDMTPARVAAMARRLGVRTPLDVRGAYVPSLGLGSIAVSPLDMASAYATIASGGVYSQPMAIRQVVLADGKVDARAGWGVPTRRRVIPDGVAAVVTKILAENVQYGTGTRAGFGRPAAGKTGTTDNYGDAWFVGYVPQLDTAVWVGYPRGEIPMVDVHGIAVTGGSFPAEIWHLFMQEALAGTPVLSFAAPSRWPTWKPFRRGPFALSYDPYATTATTATAATGTAAPATTPAGAAVPTTTMAPTATSPSR